LRRFLKNGNLIAVSPNNRLTPRSTVEKSRFASGNDFDNIFTIDFMICPLQIALETAILRFAYILPAGKVLVKKGAGLSKTVYTPNFVFSTCCVKIECYRISNSSIS
ncbi:MAG: hypothetical protein NTW48_01990, partial [Chloroflexi bacterium]|nr:hypothetical protein [Chloroflexota bacterium]